MVEAARELHQHNHRGHGLTLAGRPIKQSSKLSPVPANTRVTGNEYDRILRRKPRGFACPLATCTISTVKEKNACNALLTGYKAVT